MRMRLRPLEINVSVNYARLSINSVQLETFSNYAAGGRETTWGISIRSIVGYGSKLRLGGDVRCTTALPPKAEVHRQSCYVARVPQPAHAAQQKASKTEEGAVTSASDPRYCLSACAFSADNSDSLRKVITATLRVR